MAAPEGNEFWKLRSKHGRDKIFATPELLLRIANEYFQWCINHPLIEIDFRGKDAERIELPHPRPFTLSGLVIYMDTSERFWGVFRKSQEDQQNEGFLRVITRIEQIIRTQKFEYAATGFFNANIISRDLGLADKTDLQHSGIAPPSVVQWITVEKTDGIISKSEEEIKSREGI